MADMLLKEIAYSVADLRRIIDEKQHRHDDIDQNWLRITKDMEGGELREYKQFCIDEETIIDVLRNTIQLLNTDVESLRPKGEWISVEDRLPETNGYHVWVIACVNGKKSCVRMFERRMVRGKLVERFKYPWETISDENITHWMPLPEPPKGE